MHMWDTKSYVQETLIYPKIVVIYESSKVKRLGEPDGEVFKAGIVALHIKLPVGTFSSHIGVLVGLHGSLVQFSAKVPERNWMVAQVLGPD